MVPGRRPFSGPSNIASVTMHESSTLLPFSSRSQEPLSQLEENLSVTFMEDVHNQPNAEVGLPQVPQENPEDVSRDLLVVILFTSLMGIMAISPGLINRD